MTGPVILDCDNTIKLPTRDEDDGLALLFLPAQPEVALRGVSTCFGNAPRLKEKVLPLASKPSPVP